MPFLQEPDLDDAPTPERAFQNVLKKEIASILEKKKADGQLFEYCIFEGFGLDIAIFLKWSNNECSTKFFELKAFTGQRQGGVGFGNGQGRGAQVDILLRSTTQLTFLNRFMRWILVDGTEKSGTSRYAMFDNSYAKKAAMGIAQRGKQNNFRINDLMDKPFSWAELSREIEVFLSS